MLTQPSMETNTDPQDRNKMNDTHDANGGNLIGPHNMWLAATCLTYGLTMVTGNLREFRRVEGLKVEAWT
jgi:predicted nucleic acid-binding protein